MHPFCEPWLPLLPALDAGHLDAGQRLAVTLALVVAGLVLELVDPDLRTLGVLGDLAGHRYVGKLGRVGHQVVTVDEEDSGELERIAGRTRELLDLDNVALGNLVLLAAGLDDRVHGRGLPETYAAMAAAWRMVLSPAQNPGGLGHPGW